MEKEPELKLTKVPVKVVQCFNDKGEMVDVKLTGKETIREAMDIISMSCRSEDVQELSEAMNKGFEKISKRA
jgi:hypothetical protein